jgi:hypothetical protein
MGRKGLPLKGPGSVFAPPQVPTLCLICTSEEIHPGGHAAAMCPKTTLLSLLSGMDANLQSLRYTHAMSLGITGTTSWRHANRLVAVHGASIISRGDKVHLGSPIQRGWPCRNHGNLPADRVGTQAIRLSFHTTRRHRTSLRLFPLWTYLRLQRSALRSIRLPSMFPTYSYGLIKWIGGESSPCVGHHPNMRISCCHKESHPFGNGLQVLLQSTLGFN